MFEGNTNRDFGCNFTVCVPCITNNWFVLFTPFLYSLEIVCSEEAAVWRMLEPSYWSVRNHLPFSKHSAEFLSDSRNTALPRFYTSHIKTDLMERAKTCDYYDRKYLVTTVDIFLKITPFYFLRYWPRSTSLNFKRSAIPKTSSSSSVLESFTILTWALRLHVIISLMALHHI